MKINTKLFIQLLKSVMVLIPIPSIVLAIVGATSLVAIRNVTHEYEENTANSVYGEISEDYDNIKLGMYQLVYNSIISDYIKNPIRNYYTEALIQKELFNKVHQNSIVEEIYVYFMDYDYILSDSSGSSSRRYYIRNYSGGDYDKWLDTIRSNSINYKFYNDNRKDNPNLIIHPIYYLGHIKGQVAIRLSDIYIRDRLSSIMYGETKEVVLYNRGQLCFSVGENLVSDDSGLFEALVSGNKSITIDRRRYNLTKTGSDNKGILIGRIAERSLLFYASLGTTVIVFLGIILLIILIIWMIYIVVQKSLSPAKIFFESLYGNLRSGEEVDFDKLEDRINESIREKNKLLEKLSLYEKEVSKLYLSRLYMEESTDGGAIINGEEYGLTGRYFLSVCVVNSAMDNNTYDYKEVQEIVSTYMDEHLKNYTKVIPYKNSEEQYFLVNGNANSLEDFKEKILNATGKIRKELHTHEDIVVELFISSVVEGIENIHKTYKEVGVIRTQNEQKREKEIEKDKLSMDKIKGIIDANLRDANISVASIAYELEISPSYLSRYFKKHEEIGVLDYIHKRRIDKAKEMLDKDNNYKIKDVAEMVGFYNITTFIRVFRKYTGKTPGEYRENSII